MGGEAQERLRNSVHIAIAMLKFIETMRKSL